MSIKLNDNEKNVLTALAECTRSGGELCMAFKSIASYTEPDLDEKAVRRACRSLKVKGFAEFHRGLMDDDGKVAGSGYCVSDEGEAFLSPCDVCGCKTTYEYKVNERGETDFIHGTIAIRECKEHYKQSPKLKTNLL